MPIRLPQDVGRSEESRTLNTWILSPVPLPVGLRSEAWCPLPESNEDAWIFSPLYSPHIYQEGKLVRRDGVAPPESEDSRFTVCPAPTYGIPTHIYK